MRIKSITCKICKKRFDVLYSQWTAYGRKYCSMKCSGIGCRNSKEEKLLLKKLYDIQRRDELGDVLKYRKRKAYYENHEEHLKRQKKYRTTAKYKRYMKKFLKTYYTDEWKKHKKDYDRKFRSKRNFGEFWESAYVELLINDEIKKTHTKYDVALENGTLNKSLRRKRGTQETKSM